MGSFTRLTYHIVFGTNFRRKSIRNEIVELFYEYIELLERHNIRSKLRPPLSWLQVAACDATVGFRPQLVRLRRRLNYRV